MYWLTLALLVVCAHASPQYTKTAGVKGGHSGRGYQYHGGENLVSNFYNNSTQTGYSSQQGSYGGYAMRTNLTETRDYEKGVCYIEVPTASLVRDPTHVPAGNGSRSDLSRIRSCCAGYIRNIHNYRICDPVCEEDCVNGLCSAPNTCTCFPDHVKNLAGFCIPTCPIGCQNGQCAGGECICKDGYRLDSDGRFCVPYCREQCGGVGRGGNCTAPNTCECQNGYKSTPEGSCKPSCDRCRNGECVGPNQCRCTYGYQKDAAGDCVPQCSSPCTPPNRCVAPNVCDNPSNPSTTTTISPYGQRPGYDPNNPYGQQPQNPNNPHQQPYYPGNQSPYYPGHPQSQYPGNSPSGYPGNPPSGYPGNPPSGYPGNPSSGYPSNPSSGYPGNSPSGYPSNPASGYPGNPPSSYPSNPQHNNPTYPKPNGPGSQLSGDSQPTSRPGSQPNYPGSPNSNSSNPQSPNYGSQRPQYSPDGQLINVNIPGSRPLYPDSQYAPDQRPNSGNSNPNSTQTLPNGQYYPGSQYYPGQQYPEQQRPDPSPIYQQTYQRPNAEPYYPNSQYYPAQQNYPYGQSQPRYPQGSEYQRNYPDSQMSAVEMLCSEPCVNGTCVGRDVCACNTGYVPIGGDSSRCEPHCTGCSNGVCVSPYVCLCNPGYYKDFSVKGRTSCVRRIRRSADTSAALNVADVLVFEIPDDYIN